MGNRSPAPFSSRKITSINVESRSRPETPTDRRQIEVITPDVQYYEPSRFVTNWNKKLKVFYEQLVTFKDIRLTCQIGCLFKHQQIMLILFQQHQGQMHHFQTFSIGETPCDPEFSFLFVLIGPEANSIDQ